MAQSPSSFKEDDDGDLDPLLLSLLFPLSDVPADFNFNRFIKFVFVNERQKEECQQVVLKLMKKYADEFDFCYSLVEGKARETTQQSSAAASSPESDLLSSLPTPDRHVIGLRVQVDYKQTMDMVSADDIDQVSQLIEPLLVPSAPIPPPPSAAGDDSGEGPPGVVQEIVYDNFVQEVRASSPLPAVVILTAEDCPVCALCHDLLPVTAALPALRDRLRFFQYNLSKNHLPPGITHEEITGTPMFLYFPPPSAADLPTDPALAPPFVELAPFELLKNPAAVLADKETSNKGDGSHPTALEMTAFVAIPFCWYQIEGTESDRAEVLDVLFEYIERERLMPSDLTRPIQDAIDSACRTMRETRTAQTESKLSSPIEYVQESIAYRQELRRQMEFLRAMMAGVVAAKEAANEEAAAADAPSAEGGDS
ncbi:unnamed protein product [Vitrella brassicaformis CCMP3155]|uniref:Thioredoxin domain-containing protein n=1 Tax=Vitrella brassicaformis (strain CCMP3155) TaxID=1169540 RepID=A0A0G4GXY2_VITBC|nr:unnamed protein product [Vitrella brassicaformis CCMP3155]|eukprot:CEM35967.1 unnamed protein product [Vitrella brassicaformis CCMP3155]